MSVPGRSGVCARALWAARRTSPALVAVALAACFVPQPPSADSNGGSIGHFRTRLARPDAETFEPAQCESGDRQAFLGVDLRSAGDGPVVRLVVEPLTGPAVRVFDPTDPLGRTATYRRSDCKRFDVAVEATGWKVDEVRDYSVDLSLDCEHGNGSLLAGSARAPHCH